MAPLRGSKARAHLECTASCSAPAQQTPRRRLGACGPSGHHSPWPCCCPKRCLLQEGSARPPGCPCGSAMTQDGACTGSLCGRQPTALGRVGVFSAIHPSLRTRRPRPWARPTVTQDGAHAEGLAYVVLEWAGHLRARPCGIAAIYHHGPCGKPQRHLSASTVHAGRAGVGSPPPLALPPAGPPARWRRRSKPQTSLPGQQALQDGLGLHLPPPVIQNTSSSQTRPLKPHRHSRRRLRSKPHPPPVGPQSTGVRRTAASIRHSRHAALTWAQPLQPAVLSLKMAPAQ